MGASSSARATAFNIVEFRSVVDAVRCAIEVQNGMVERNAGVASERRIEYRVGIHLGDVVEEADGDLMGDASISPPDSKAFARPARSVSLRTPIVREVDLSSSRLRFCQLCQRLRSIGLGRPAVWGRQWGKHSARRDGAGPAEEAQGPGPVRPRRYDPHRHYRRRLRRDPLDLARRRVPMAGAASPLRPSSTGSRPCAGRARATATSSCGSRPRTRPDVRLR